MDALDIKLYRRYELSITRVQLAALGMSINEFVDFIPFNARQLEQLCQLGVGPGAAPFLVGGYRTINEYFAFNIVQFEGRLRDVLTRDPLKGGGRK